MQLKFELVISAKVACTSVEPIQDVSGCCMLQPKKHAFAGASSPSTAGNLAYGLKGMVHGTHISKH